MADNRVMKDRVADIIREAIFDGHLQPGERLHEEMVAMETGASRGPVREAFMKLESEGLLIREPYRGTYVASLSRRDMEELFSIREVLEAFATRLAVHHMTDDDIQHLRQIIDAKRKAQGDGNYNQASLNEEFHNVIYEKCGNKRLKQILTQLWAQFPKSMWQLRPSRVPQAIQEFQNILDAIESRDPDTAAKYMAEHIRVEVTHCSSCTTSVSSALKLDRSTSTNDTARESCKTETPSSGYCIEKRSNNVCPSTVIAFHISSTFYSGK